MTKALDGQHTMVLGGGSLAGLVAERIGSEGAWVVTAPRAADLGPDLRESAEAAVVSLESVTPGADEAAAALDGVVALLVDNPRLRRVVVLATEGPSASLARTLAVYATAHTAERDLRINALTLPESSDATVREHLGDVVTALLSGLLDAVRGQTLELGSEASR